MIFKLPVKAIAEALQIQKYELLPLKFSKLTIDKWDIQRGKNLELSTNEVPIEFIKDVSTIINVVTDKGQPYEKFSISSAKRLQTKLKRYDRISTDESGKYEFSKISDIPALMKSWIENTSDMAIEIVNDVEVKLPLFKIDNDIYGEQIYLLKSVSFYKPRRDAYDSRPYVSISMVSSFLEELSTKSYYIYQNDFNKKSSILDIFELLDIEQIDAATYKEHLVDVMLSKSYLSEIKVFDCIDSMLLQNGMTVRPKKSKEKSSVVLDVNGFLNLKTDKNKNGYGKATLEDIPFGFNEFVRIPEQSVVCGYYLSGHEWFTGPVRNFKPYEFKGETFMDKLIIPDEHKDMVKMIVNFDQENIEDIIEGKSGGSLILAKGKAGLGKTLTSEVLAEAVKRPLYEIQCSQLGIRVDDIEKKFNKILENSKRWNAILVINEADVYIRERGIDIDQNAIVGVFLRLLEKSNGIVFMTTNLDIVDDAIESRAMIILDYVEPSISEFIQIFNVLANQYELLLHKDFEKSLVEYLTSNNLILTGRDAKQLCKLLKIYIAYIKTDIVQFEYFTKLIKYKS